MTVRGGKNAPYTHYENSVIVRATDDTLFVLSERFGRPVKALREHRRRLRERMGIEVPPPRSVKTVAKHAERPRESTRRFFPPLARPAWFEEDLNPRARR